MSMAHVSSRACVGMQSLHLVPVHSDGVVQRDGVQQAQDVVGALQVSEWWRRVVTRPLVSPLVRLQMRAACSAPGLSPEARLTPHRGRRPGVNQTKPPETTLGSRMRRLSYIFSVIFSARGRTPRPRGALPRWP